MIPKPPRHFWGLFPQTRLEWSRRVHAFDSTMPQASGSFLVVFSLLYPCAMFFFGRYRKIWMFQPDPYHARISVEEKIGPQDLIMASWSFATPLFKWLVCLKWIPFSLISSPKSYTLPHQHLQPFLYPKHSASKSTNESPTNGSPSRIPKRKGPELETSKRLQQQTSGLVVISYSLVIRPMTTTAATCLWNMTRIGLTTIINSSNQP